MKTPRIANAVGHIDDDLITAAAESKKKTKYNTWLKWGSIAACFAVLVIAGAAILPWFLGGNIAPGGTSGSVTPGGIDVGENAGTGERYKDYNIYAGESAIVWPWEYRTVYEKYTNIEINGVEYLGKGRTVSAELVGEIIGKYAVVGYDEINNKKYTAEFEAYKLQSIAQNQFVAVEMEGSYYIFKNDEYAPPDTLGELMETVNLSSVVELSRFSENDNTPSGKHYILNSDNYIWEVLSDCKSAAFVEDQTWTVGDRNYLSFTITSDALGIYKVAMYVTEDGYLWTNAFSWQYLFNIGEDAAGKIIKYSKENSTKAEYEPYRNSVAGTIVEITEGYILVDDSILCNDPADGITYKVLLNDLRISRYVAHGVVKVGDTVQISYEGKINEGNGNIIAGAISALKATISGGDVLIPE